MDPAVETEIQLLFQFMKKRSTDRWFLGALREGGTSRPMTPKDADRLLQLPLEEVVTIFQAEKRKRARKIRYRRPLCLSLLALAIPILGLTHYSLTVLVIWTWLIFLTAGVAAADTQQAAALALVRFDDVRTVGPLVESLPFRYVGAVAAQALVRLLPRLRATDAALLDPTQRARLNRALEGENTALTLAILKAYEQVGDVTALSEVQKIADVRGMKIRRAARRLLYHGFGASTSRTNEIPNSEIPRVAAAAKECLPFLRQSTERRQSDQELLRPADGNTTPSDILLRPAAPQASADPPNQLLRPTDDA